MKIFENFDLTNYNSYRVHAACAKAYFPENDGDLITFFSNNSDYILLGSGHNIILANDYYEKPIVLFNGNYESITLIGDDTLEVEAGALMSDVAIFAMNYSLSGIEIFYDIPSSLGGAVVMNAGASGEEIKDVLTKVQFLDLDDLQVKEILTEHISFEYRNSFFQRNTNKIVMKAWLKLKPDSQEKIKEKMESIKAQRWQKQPKEFPNAGSVFKRPKGYFVGAMIDELNLRGLTVGGSQISKKHGGFIVNFDNATGEDIVNLIRIIRSKVHERFGVWLEVEQRVIN